MLNILQRANKFLHTVSFFSGLINQCSSLTNPSNSLSLVHAQLLKLNFTSNTFLANRCIDLYLKCGLINDASKAFHEIPSKNIVSWNLYLKVLVKNSDLATARQVFDEMIERDVVSWNTMISGYISSELLDNAWEMFLDMKRDCVRPSEFTFSMLLCCVKCGDYAKEIHGCIMRNGGFCSNLVVGNALVDVYGKLGRVDYSITVFFSMEKVDLISWNSMISGCCKSGCEKFAFDSFRLMRSSGLEVDEYTVSALLASCSNVRNLDKGKQVLCLCIKMGFLCNGIVSSAAIDLFSKCNRVESAICVFKESCVFDSAICNSVIACYTSHSLEENALELFVFSFRDGIRPTEFTLSCVLDSAAVFVPVEQGSQLHSMVVKTGFNLDDIVASSLIQMYSKYGLIDFALNVFDDMIFKDLIAWNTMLQALTHHGKLVEAIHLFEKLLQTALHPDRITFVGVLSACSYGGFLEEGLAIFSSMQNQHGVDPTNDHYSSIVEMLIRAGRINEAVDLLHVTGYEPCGRVWESILRTCEDYGDVNLIEKIAQRLMELEPQLPISYLILANIYEERCRWESLVRVKRKMRRMKIEEEVDCSWIGIKGHTFPFEANQMVHYGGKNVYSVLGLLMQEIGDEKFA